MKRVKIVTECGEETNFYVEQDVETITVDGEEWVKKTEQDENEKITELLDISGCWGVSTEFDVEGIYLEDDGGGFIDIKNSKDETLASIHKDNLKDIARS